jgi:NADH-quinone oxidoreductase subunit G
VRIGLIGEQVDLTYPYEFLGRGPQTLAEVAEGRHSFADVLREAKRPMVILGQGALARADGAQVLRLAGKLAAACGLVKPQAQWNGFNVLHTAAARVGGLDLGFTPADGGLDAAGMLQAAARNGLDALLLLGADDVAVPQTNAVVIYIGSHGEHGAAQADIVLPAAAFSEQNGVWVNTEGRVQHGRRAVLPKGEAREEWAILRALSARLGKTLPYDDLGALRRKLMAEHPSFGGVDYAPGALGAEEFDPSTLGADGPVGSEPFVSPVRDFYLTNVVCRVSETMAACSQATAQALAARAQAHG